MSDILSTHTHTHTIHTHTPYTHTHTIHTHTHPLSIYSPILPHISPPHLPSCPTSAPLLLLLFLHRSYFFQLNSYSSWLPPALASWCLVREMCTWGRSVDYLSLPPPLAPGLYPPAWHKALVAVCMRAHTYTVCATPVFTLWDVTTPSFPVALSSHHSQHDKCTFLLTPPTQTHVDNTGPNNQNTNAQ